MSYKTPEFVADAKLVMDITNVIMQETEGEIEPEDLKKEIDFRLAMIVVETHGDNGKETNLSYCILCNAELGDKRILTRRIHDIINHNSYYVQCCDVIQHEQQPYY